MSSPIMNENSLEKYNPIYKVNHLVDGKIETIYIFFGKKIDTKNNAEYYKNIFTDKEIETINAEKINVVFLAQQIHFDDSIGIIKLKILSELKQTIALEEIYLFCEKIETLNSISLYQSLTQNKKISLTKIRLEQFLSNIVSSENENENKNGDLFGNLPLKDVYDYDDILALNITGKKYIINKVLGQKFFMVENEYPYVCNPYLVNGYDSFFEKSVRKSLSTLNSNLLLNTGEIVNNNIYLCTTKNVLEYLTKKSISEENTIKIYYPFLYQQNINSLEVLEEKQPTLIENNKKLLDNKTIDYFKTISMFYDIFKLKKSNLNYLSNGIKYINAIMKPAFTIKIPLEIIFKLLHATIHNPLIKFNPSSRQENLYRLFTDKVAKDGRKIPFLKKAVIFKLMKNIGKTKSVSVFIENQMDMNTQNFICEFDENGYIHISCEFTIAISLENINVLFKNKINPLISEIKELLEQSGYNIPLFNSLLDENVDIKQLSYECQIEINKPVKLESLQGCISTVFNNETSHFKKDMHLRFKRVSNFNKVTSQEAFILEKQEDGYRGDEIVQALLENFPDDLKREDAIELVKKMANEMQVERGVRKTDIRIKDNPGFKTTLTNVVKLENNNSKIVVLVENINDIFYLYTIPIYIDSIIRLTQNSKSTSYPLKEINILCKSGIKEDIKLPDIISPVESEISELEIASIQDEEIHYNKFSDALENEMEGEKTKNALDLFYGDSDEEEESDSFQQKGGEIEDSESSIESAALSSPNIDSPVEQQVIASEDSSESSIVSHLTSLQMESNVSSNPKTPQISSKLIIADSDSGSESLQEMNNQENIKITQEEEEQENEDEDEDEEDEQENEDEQEQEQESFERENELEEPEKNIDNLGLKKPYYFQTRIENKDPVLIIKQNSKEYNSYSRVCSSDTRRQPVILTDAELAKINKEHKGYLREEDVIKYGSDPNNQFNYICPRYWCLKTNSIIDPNDLKEITENGKKILVHPTCGKVLPEDATKVIPGHYIYEFYKPTKANPDYKRYPNFQVDKHPDGYCLPCCFDKWNTVGRINAKNNCLATKEDQVKKKDVGHEEQSDYIKGPEKFPLEPGRWGYLPLPIQKLLHEVNADCQVNKTNTAIKPNHPCLLRHGVEVNDKQSFISCISDALFFAKKIVDDDKGKLSDKVAKILSIPEMKERIIKSLNIDNFIKYQNGNLVNDFHDPKKEVDVEKYNQTKLYSKINKKNEYEMLYYKKVISAYENFILYMKDDETIIDHTYLWDIVCQPNKYLFGNAGINLIILEIPNDDITNNVQLICPTNHYSAEFYEARKPTLVLMKEDNYYEPIYSYLQNNNKIVIAKLFSEYDPHLSTTMRAVFKDIIKPILKMMCKPLESMPNIYLAKRPLLLYNLIQKLDKYNYKVLKQIVNFNNKVIGVTAESPTGSIGFVPCYPSAIDENLKKDLDYVFMTDINIWKTYKETIDFLTQLERKSKKRNAPSEIPCKPAFKIVEDEVIVGILTETNQFIQLSEPILESNIPREMNIPSFKNSNFILNKNAQPMISIDVPSSTLTTVDEERVEYIKKIKLENAFFNTFRNTIRILLNNYENVKWSEEIERELSKEYIIYSNKLTTITSLLKKMVANKMEFIGDENYYKVIDKVSTCVVKNKDKCGELPNLCVVTNNGVCKLILPEKNLITKNYNEAIYYGRMTDELIRYSRIKTFMFQSNTYLSFGNISYNLREDEIILIQSLLTQEYFDTMIPAIINKYVYFNSHDEVEPVISQTYENKIPSLDYAIGMKQEKTCKKKTVEKISIGKWKTCFPENYKEIQYGKFTYCTYEIIMDLYEKKNGEKITMNTVKNDLFQEYKKYLENYKEKIVDILIIEGKKTLGDQVLSEILSFSSFIFTDGYFLTPLDLWLLVEKYEIPTIFISNKYILETDYQKHIFVAYSNDNSDKYAFIIIPGLRTENIPGYKIIESNTNEVFLSLENLSTVDCLNEIREAILEKKSISYYLEHFTKNPTTKYTKKKPLLIEEEESEEENNVKENSVKKKNLIIEDTTPVSEEILIFPKKTRKNREKKYVEKRKPNPNTKTKKKLLIIESSSPDVIEG